MNFAASATAGGEWVAGLGDPTPMGWFTVAAYFISAVLCLCCAARPLFSSSDNDRRADLRFWLILAGLMFLFGVNKQLDLQTLLTATFKGIAEAVGLYGIRGLLQVLFIALVVACGGWLAFTFFKRYRRPARRNQLAVFGIALLAVFVAIRATSFHYMDSLINATFLGLRLNWIIELGSIAMIAMAAIIHLRRQRRQSGWQGKFNTENENAGLQNATPRRARGAGKPQRIRHGGFKPSSKQSPRSSR